MSYMVRSLLSSILLALYIVCTINAENNSIFSEKYEVHIINGLKPTSPRLRFHCKSKNDDLGIHIPRVGEDFNWHFNRNFWGTTQFYCYFWYGNEKQQSFDVYNESIRDKCFPVAIVGTGYCYWLVKDDGFYASYTNGLWKKTYAWA